MFRIFHFWKRQNGEQRRQREVNKGKSENQTLASLINFMRSIFIHSQFSMLFTPARFSFHFLIEIIVYRFRFTHTVCVCVLHQQQRYNRNLFSQNHHKILMKLAYTGKNFAHFNIPTLKITPLSHSMEFLHTDIVGFFLFFFFFFLAFPPLIFLLSLLLHLSTHLHIHLCWALLTRTQTQKLRKKRSLCNSDNNSNNNEIFLQYNKTWHKQKQRDESFESLIRFRIIIVLHYYLFFREWKKNERTNVRTNECTECQAFLSNEHLNITI